jgi:hypothetical protein
MNSYDLPIKCKCSKVQGVIKQVNAKNGNHLTCMCIDCQTFAHHLGVEDRVLDENGGTEIFQTSPSKIEFLEGKEFVKCLRLSPTGTSRWYAECCNTPLANTIALEKDFAGVILDSIDFEKIDKFQALGPIKYKVMGKYGKGELPKGTSLGFPKFLVLKMIFKLTLGKLLKSYLPNPFFNEETGEHRSTPTILPKEQRAKIKSKILASS